MNGFIFKKTLRHIFLVGACLTVGTAFGFKTKLITLDSWVEKTFLATKEINFTKINWVQNTFFTEPFALASVDYPSSELEKATIALSPIKIKNVKAIQLTQNKKMDRQLKTEKIHLIQSSAKSEPVVIQKKCKPIKNIELYYENNESSNLNTQYCANSNVSNRDWFIIREPGFTPTLVYPFADQAQQKIPMFDANAIALMGFKARTQQEAGNGMVMGTIPEGYRVELSGQGEEVQYFYLKGQKLFSILNAEIGSGVISVISDVNPKEIATVFVPVVSDVITFLNISSPEKVEINIEVKKGKNKNRSDLEKLAVFVSTEIQRVGVTDREGKAVLPSVLVVPHYPLYIDAESLSHGKKSFQYRYEIKYKPKKIRAALRQYEENVLHQWSGQIAGNIDSYRGSVIGEYSKNKIGFKKTYRVSVKSFSKEDTTKLYTVLWDDHLALNEPLEGDIPRFFGVNVPEGLLQIQLKNEAGEIMESSLVPVSPKVINVIGNIGEGN